MKPRSRLATTQYGVFDSLTGLPQYVRHSGSLAEAVDLYNSQPSVSSSDSSRAALDRQPMAAIFLLVTNSQGVFTGERFAEEFASE